MAMGKLIGLLAAVGLGGLALSLFGAKEAKAAPGTPGAEADAFIHSSERANSNASNAKFQIGQALNTGDPNTMLATADAIERGLGMPLTAQNLRSRANQLAAGVPVSSPPKAPSGPRQAPRPAAPAAPPRPPPQPAERTPPPEVIQRMTEALATNLPATVELLAAQLEREGWRVQAQDLRNAAAVMRNAQAVMGSPGPLPPATPPMVVVSSSGQPVGLPVPPAASTAAVDPRQLLAGKVVMMLRASSKGKEDKELVRLFQQQEADAGRYIGVPDGLYGPKTATLLLFYNIVPPKPWYWPKAKTAEAYAAYRKLMLSMASNDTARADEWQTAAKVP